MKDLQKKFGENCKRLRDAQGWSQEELAEKSGLSLSYISEVERGNSNPTLTTSAKLAAGLQADISELLDFHYADATPQEIRDRLIAILSNADIKTISGLNAAVVKAFRPK